LTVPLPVSVSAALSGGRSPAEGVDLDYTAKSLTEFAAQVGINLCE
jgi:hypothetical protein